MSTEAASGLSGLHLASTQAPRRLALLDIQDPDPPSIAARLTAAYPNLRATEATEFQIGAASKIGPHDTPLWVWTEGREKFIADASRLLREFFYPLVHGGRDFVLALPLSRSDLARKRLRVDTRNGLDLEDIGLLLTEDVITVTASMLDTLAGKVALTPIEVSLEAALREARIDARPQVRLDRYLADFAVKTEAGWVAIEADGREFHDPETDAARDSAVSALGVTTLRFAGSEIYRDASGCALRVKQFLEGHVAAPTQYRVDPNLDADQQAAAMHSRGAMRLLAPAGAGETKTMTNHVLALLNRGAEPSSILMLAFNKKACDQLIDDLTKRGVAVSSQKLLDPASPGVVCATLNAFGVRYQREVMGVRHDTSDDVAAKLLQQAIARSGFDYSRVARGCNVLECFLNALSRSRSELVEPSLVDVEVELIDGPSEFNLAPVSEHYHSLRLDAGVQAFDDQLHTAVVDLLGNPTRRGQLQRHFKHVLVDEYQDLNEVQLVLCDMLSRPHRCLYAVGDDDQLIYGWRSAKTENILGFHDRMPIRDWSTTRVLSTNYRCARSIVGASRRVIDHNEIREPKEIVAYAPNDEGIVQFLGLDELSGRLGGLIAFLRTEKAQTDAHWRQFAVLTRYKAQQPIIAFALDQAGIPRSKLLRYRFFGHPQMRLLRAYMQLVSAPQDATGDQFKNLLNRPNRYLRNATLEQVAKSEDPWGAVCAGVSSEQGLRRLVLAQNAMAERVAEGVPSATVIADVREEFGLNRYWEDALSDSESTDDAAPPMLADLLADIAVGVPNVAEFLSYWDDQIAAEQAREDMSTDDLKREDDVDRDAVVIGTMHSAKGREYRGVALFDYHRDLAGLDQEAVEEERRVFYVGMTRAINSLLITVNTARRSPLHRFAREAIAPVEVGEQSELLRRRDELHPLREQHLAKQLQAGEAVERITSGAELADARRESAAQKHRLEALRSAADQATAEAKAISAVGVDLAAIEAHRTALASWQTDAEAAQREHDAVQNEIFDLAREQRALDAHDGPSVIGRLAGASRRRDRKLADLRQRMEAARSRLGELAELTRSIDEQRAAAARALHVAEVIHRATNAQQRVSTAAEGLEDAENRVRILESHPDHYLLPLQRELRERTRSLADCDVEIARINGRLTEIDLVSPAAT